MSSADHDQGDQLNDVLDALAVGKTPSTRDIDPNMTEVVRRFFARDDTPAPPSDLAHQIWEELMNQSAIAGAISLSPLVVKPPALNGHSQPRPWRQRSSTASVQHRRMQWGRWGLGQLAAAALILITLGLGYYAFDPFGNGPDQPSSIPAAGVPAGTPAVAASPTASFIARDSHLIIGTWMLDVDGIGGILLPVTFNSDGTLVMYLASNGISIGTWHPTGERTAELVWATQGILDKQDLTDPTITPEGATLDTTRMSVWRVTITIDASGKTMTSFGTYDSFEDGVSVYREKPWEMKWTRMIVDPTAVFPTPTP
jgi:hypothetical protein